MTASDHGMSPSSAASSGTPTDGQDAWLDLVSEELSTGLADVQRASLAELLAGLPGGGFGTQIDDWERLAGDIALATAIEQYEPLPGELCEKLRTEAVSMLGNTESSETSTRAEPVNKAEHDSLTETAIPRGVLLPSERMDGVTGERSRETFAWMAAAAALLVAVFGWLPAWRAGPEEPLVASMEALRAAMLADAATDVMQLAWSATEDEAVLAGGDLGDLVFNPATQEGYMRFRGLAANDPATQQYQLWVFDAEQDERYPVDGGVFDVPAGSDEVIVPIRTAIAVREPTLFAITVEKPGGVVVSSRERLPLLAKVADPT
jgi:anti-sigma-K factor RskA